MTQSWYSWVISWFGELVVRHKSVVSWEAGQCVLARVSPWVGVRKVIRTLQQVHGSVIPAKEFLSCVEHKGKAGGSQETTGVSRRVFFLRGDSSISRCPWGPILCMRTSVCLTGQALLPALWSADRQRAKKAILDSSTDLMLLCSYKAPLMVGNCAESLSSNCHHCPQE